MAVTPIGGDLVVAGLSKNYGGSVVLDGVTGRFESRRVTGLLGANGSGKSTFAKCLVALESHRGVIAISTADGDRNVVPGDVFAVFAERTLHPWWTVKRNMAYQLNLSGAHRLPWIARLVPPELITRRASALSVGQATLVQVAIALASSAQVVFLDEFSAGLDRQNRRLIADSLKEVARAGRVVIVAGHDFEAISPVATRFVLVKDRKLVDITPEVDAVGNLEAVYEDNMG